MKTYLVVSAVGQDQPGLVNRVTSAIADLGGNIELQRAAHMADEFAVMVLCTVERDPEAAVNALLALRSDDLLVTARVTQPASSSAAGSETHAALAASGADQPGIIDALSGRLYQHGVNIESMDYDLEHAPMSGQRLFRMEARLLVPSAADIDALHDQIRALEEEYNFDVILRHPVE